MGRWGPSQNLNPDGLSRASAWAVWKGFPGRDLETLKEDLHGERGGAGRTYVALEEENSVLGNWEEV